MTEKEKYRKSCETEYSIPIYSRDWWLDCLCGENLWDVLLVENETGIEAAFLFYRPHSGVIFMPPFTQTLGIWFNPAFIKTDYTKELVRKQQLCMQLIERLPKSNYFYLRFDTEFTDWLPFYWNGFKQTTRYTYRIPDIQQPEKLWERFNDQTKRNIRKAEKNAIEVKRGISVDTFFSVREQIFERQGKKTLYTPELRRLIETARSRNQGDIWGAYDPEGNLHSAVFIVWQHSCAYYIAGGNDSRFRESGSHGLTMWNAIRDVSENAVSFDFEGSMLKGVEYFFRGFGARQMPYFEISKGKIRLFSRIFLQMKKMLK